MDCNQPTKIRAFDNYDESFWENNRERIDGTLKSTSLLFLKEYPLLHILASSTDWFMEEWGRDTFVSLTGLLLVHKRYDFAKNILVRWGHYEKKGLMPTTTLNTLQYNNADTSMWFLYALESYFHYTHDAEIIFSLKHVIKNILYRYLSHTFYVEEGCLKEVVFEHPYVKTPPRATWMDASALGKLPPITPREGKVVEINALLYNALRFAKSLENHLGVDFDMPLNYYIKEMKKRFAKDFWWDDQHYVYDLIDGNDEEAKKIRPNAVFALRTDLFTSSQKEKANKVIEMYLLTPGGLRTLSPTDKDYRGNYNTYDPVEIKDLAYHNGSAWPWLIGGYADMLASFLSSSKLKATLKYILAPLLDFMLRSPYNSLPELFSGDALCPGGTRSQAWSVAEVSRVVYEYNLLD